MGQSRDSVQLWVGLGRPLRHLSRPVASIVLAAVLAALAWSSWATAQMAGRDAARVEAQEGIGDIALYRNIHARADRGEDYYVAALEEHRANGYPTRPFVTVRLPTLAWLDGALGGPAWVAVAVALMIGAVVAFLMVLEPLAGLVERAVAAVLLLVAALPLFTDDALLLHELPAGLLLTLALPLFALAQAETIGIVVAALALAIRELALPFLLLWGVFAVVERRGGEMLAVAAVVLLFALGLTMHAREVTAHLMPGDLASPGWAAFEGFALPLYALTKLSALMFVPVWLAAPIALLPILGWIGLGGRLGIFASLWFAGFALAMALFARPSNIYWVWMLLPAYAAGLAFVPRALADLVMRAIKAQESQT